MSEAATPTETAPEPRREEEAKFSLSSLIVLASLGILPALFATGFTSYEFFRREVGALLAATALATWSVEVLRQRGVKMGAGRAMVPLILFILWVTITPAWSPTWLVGAQDVSGLIAAGSIALILAAPAGKPLTWSHFSGAVGVGAALAGLFGLLDLAGVGVFTHVWDPEGATGSFDSLEFASNYYVIALPLLAAGVATGHKISRGLAAAGLLLGGAHLALTGTSTLLPAMALAAVALPIAGLMFRKQATGGVKPLALGGAALIAVVAAIGPFGVKTEFERYNSATSTPIVSHEQVLVNPESVRDGIPRNTRFAITRYEQIKSPEEADYLSKVRSEMAAQKVLTGQGAGAWWVGQTRVVFADHAYLKGLFDIYPAFRSTHHGFYKILIEYGAIGLLLFGVWLLAALMLAVDMMRVEEEPAEGYGTILFGTSAAVLAGTLMMFDGVVLDGQASTLLFLASFGFLANYGGGLLSGEGSERGWAMAWDGNGHAFSPALFGICFAAGLLTLGGFSLTSDYLRSKGDQLMLYSKFDEASPAYASAHEVFPAFGEVLYNEALAETSRREAKKSPAEVIDTLRLARVLRPDDARIVHQQALVHTSRAEPEQAIDLEKTAIHRFPNYLDAYKNLALSYQRKVNMADSAKALEQMLALEPPKKLRVSVEESLGQMYEGPLGKPRKALEYYKLGLKHAELRFMRERLQAKVTELSKQIERERLLREGKPVPKELMPSQKSPHDAAGEILGIPHPPGDGHGHGHDH
jgi:tetratricopeptide (TPR) repeat protein